MRISEALRRCGGSLNCNLVRTPRMGLQFNRCEGGWLAKTQARVRPLRCSAGRRVGTWRGAAVQRTPLRMLEGCSQRGAYRRGGADGGGRRAFAARGGVRACMLSGARVAEGSADGCGKGDAMAGCRGAKKVRLREAHATAEMGGVRDAAAPRRSRFAESRSLGAKLARFATGVRRERTFLLRTLSSDLPRLNGCFTTKGNAATAFPHGRAVVAVWKILREKSPLSLRS